MLFQLREMEQALLKRLEAAFKKYELTIITIVDNHHGNCYSCYQRQGTVKSTPLNRY